ncbi:hypothetical protein DMENIID0001_120980 [Sergentomyia squamirostris]
MGSEGSRGVFIVQKKEKKKNVLGVLVWLSHASMFKFPTDTIALRWTRYSGLGRFRVFQQIHDRIAKYHHLQSGGE